MSPTRRTSRTPERALVGMFWCSLFPSLVSNTSPLPSLSRTPERARTGMFWCSRTSPLPLPRLEHQNEPTWACSDVQAPLPISTTRTSPHGLILVLAHLPSLSPSSQTSPLPLPHLFPFLVYFSLSNVSFFVL